MNREPTFAQTDPAVRVRVFAKTDCYLRHLPSGLKNAKDAAVDLLDALKKQSRLDLHFLPTVPCSFGEIPGNGAKL